MKDLKVVDIFESIQGEGNRAGQSSIFIRLSGCNKSCWFCDTDHSHFVKFTIEMIKIQIKDFKSDWIVWTGGEPLLQLTTEIIMYFKFLGYNQAIETNGTLKPPNGLDWISISPKVDSIQELHDNFSNFHINEFRFVLDKSDLKLIPKIKDLPKADFYYISPIFYKNEIVDQNMKFTLKFVELNPEWRISIQQHKIWHVK